MIKRDTRSQLKKLKLGQPDMSLLLCVVFLLTFGLLMVYSASAISSYVRLDDTFFYFKRQIIWILVGSFFGYIVYRLPIQRIRKSSRLLVIISFILCIYMLPEAFSPLREDGLRKLIEMPFVNTRNGATRWLDFGFFDLQPAEFMKLAIIIFTAAWFTISDTTKKEIEKYIQRFKENHIIYTILDLGYKLFPIIILGFTTALILAQKDLDTIAITAAIFFSVYYVGGTAKYHIFVTISAIISTIVGGIFAITNEGYRKTRLNTFLEILTKGEPTDPRAGAFQVWNGLVAIGSGGLFGVGYNESKQKLFYLQEAAYTDSIFAVIGEEFGLIGTAIVIFALLFFISRGLNIAKNAQDKFSSLVAIGITSWIGIQSFLNIAANLAIIPFAGMPLPFFSYGGSNMIMILVAIGLLLNISRQSDDISPLAKVDTRVRKL